MADVEPPRPAVWPVLLLFTALQALAFGDRFVLALLAAPVSHALRIGDAHMGLLLGAAFIVPFVLFTPLFGVLVDRFPRGWPVVAGLGISAVATAWSATADGFAALLGARLLLGVGEAAVAPAALGEIAAAASRRAGLGTALFAAGGPIGKGLALTGGGALLAVLTRGAGPAAPWREVLWVATAVNLSGAALAWRVLLVPGERASTSASPAPDPGPRADPIRLTATAAAGVAAVLASQTAAAWTPSLLVRSFALAPAQAGLATGAPLLVLAPACGLAVGWFLDRAAAGRSGEAPVLPCLVAGLAAAGGCALGLAAAPDAAWAQLAFGLLVSALGAVAVAGLRGVQIYAGDRRRSRVTAAYIAVANLIGFGVGPPLVGWLATAAGPGGGLRAALTSVLATVSLAGSAAAAVAVIISAARRRGVPDVEHA